MTSRRSGDDPSGPPSVDGVLDELRSLGEATVRSEMGPRYGIHTDRAFGVPMAGMQRLAKRVGHDHRLALDLWGTGWYEARTVAALVDDPDVVTAEQMDRWCRDFDNWAICDTACFRLFDRTADSWTMVDRWADRSAEFEKRACFALLWSLALHDREAEGAAFRHGLELIEQHAGDERHLVHTAVAMALRAIATRRPEVRAETLEVSRRLAGSEDRQARRIGRAAMKALGATAR
jgi:3-methyladenine DNA glycosylase AlkD